MNPQEVPQTFDLDSESFYVLTSSGPLDDDARKGVFRSSWKL